MFSRSIARGWDKDAGDRIGGIVIVNAARGSGRGLWMSYVDVVTAVSKKAFTIYKIVCGSRGSNIVHVPRLVHVTDHTHNKE